MLAIDDLLVSGFEELPGNPPPSVLLKPRYAVVPFHAEGRKALLSELDAWCEQGPPVAVRLIHAAEGMGKTRLALEWMRQRREQGWAAGFIAEDAPSDWVERLRALEQPVVVVLDSAEDRAALREELLQALHSDESSGLRSMRILLLARNAKDWWQLLRDCDADLGAWLDLTPPLELPPLAKEKAKRELLLDEAAEAFARVRGKPYVPKAWDSATDPRFDPVVSLHLAALCRVEGEESQTINLPSTLIDLEERAWAKERVTLPEQRTFARQLVAAATLRGGLPDLATATLVAERLLGHALSAGEQQVLLQLQRVYQGSGVFLPALEPEHVWAQLLDRVAFCPPPEGRPPEDWILRVLPPEEEEAVVRNGLRALARASMSRSEVAWPWFVQLLGRPLESRAVLVWEAAMAVGLSGTVLDGTLAGRLEEEGDARVASALERLTSPDSKFMPQGIAGWMARTLLQALPESGEDVAVEAKRARLFESLASLVDVERSDEAEARLKATEIYRRLSRHDPDAFLPRLAHSLDELGKVLTGSDGSEEALAATREAVEVWRALELRNPGSFQSNLATSLDSLCYELSELGRGEAALEAKREAAEAYRAHARRNPKTLQMERARCLDDLDDRLTEVGRHQEALKVKREAAEVYGMLARSDATAFLRDFIQCLDNLSHRLSEVGRREEALAVASEAVGVSIPLARRHPGSTGQGFTLHLAQLGMRLSEGGRKEQGLAATREVVELLRARPLYNRGESLRELARGLELLEEQLTGLGRHEEARKVKHEAVALAAELQQLHLKATRNSRAHHLDKLGVSLSHEGRTQEALEATREAVSLWRELLRERPDSYRDAFVASLDNLGMRLSEAGRNEEALEVTREAVDTYRALMRSSRHHHFRPRFVASLHRLSERLSEGGRAAEALEVRRELVDRRMEEAQWGLTEHWVIINIDGAVPKAHEARRAAARKEALEARREVVDVYRALARSNPEAFQPLLAPHLYNLALQWRQAGNSEEALAVMREAVALQRELARGNPDALRPDLAASLHSLSSLSGGLGRKEEALEAALEAVALWRTLTGSNPDNAQNNLANSLHLLGRLLGMVGRTEEALQATRESVALLRELVEHPFSRGQSDLAQSLTTLGIALKVMGQTEEALQVLEEAAERLWSYFERHPRDFAWEAKNIIRHLSSLYETLQRPRPLMLQQYIAAYDRLVDT